MRGVILCVLLLATATAFDFDDDEVVTDAPVGGKAAADAADSESAGLTIAVTHTLGTAAPSVRGHLFVRAGVPPGPVGAAVGGWVLQRRVLSRRARGWIWPLASSCP